ncbi:hypothetical protein GCM10027562_02600 [Arthrobacter pigmenti]
MMVTVRRKSPDLEHGASSATQCRVPVCLPADPRKALASLPPLAPMGATGCTPTAGVHECRTAMTDIYGLNETVRHPFEEGAQIMSTMAIVAADHDGRAA